jgi:hypothetical protein
MHDNYWNLSFYLQKYRDIQEIVTHDEIQQVSFHK